MNKETNFVEKPWGYEKWLAKNEKYCLKEIKLYKGCMTSLQYHNIKRETTYIHEGLAKVTLKRAGEKNYTVIENVGPGAILDLPAGDIHRIEAIEDVLMFEASTPETDDVVRLEDSYGREDKKET